jgi:GntR family transcriptional regulator
MTMEFNNARSIFLQIAESVCEKISDGTYTAGSRIPSVRELAAETGVNPNTVVRTFNELQLREIIENKRGIGFFVADKAIENIIRWKRSDFFAVVVPEFMRQMAIAGVTIKEFNEFVSNNFSKDNDENK